MMSWMARDLETAIALLDDAEPLPARIAARPSSSDDTRKDANQTWAYLLAVKRYLIGIRAQNENIVEDHAEEVDREGRTSADD